MEMEPEVRSPITPRPPLPFAGERLDASPPEEAVAVSSDRGLPSPRPWAGRPVRDQASPSGAAGRSSSATNPTAVAAAVRRLEQRLDLEHRQMQQQMHRLEKKIQEAAVRPTPTSSAHYAELQGYVDGLAETVQCLVRRQEDSLLLTSPRPSGRSKDCYMTALESTPARVDGLMGEVAAVNSVARETSKQVSELRARLGDLEALNLPGVAAGALEARGVREQLSQLCERVEEVLHASTPSWTEGARCLEDKQQTVAQLRDGIGELRDTMNEEIAAVARRVASMESELRDFRPGGRAHTQLEGVRALLRKGDESRSEHAAEVRELREKLTALGTRIAGFHELRDLREDVQRLQREGGIVADRLDEVEQGLATSRLPEGTRLGQLAPPSAEQHCGSQDRNLALESFRAELESLRRRQAEVDALLQTSGLEDQLENLRCELALLQEEGHATEVAELRNTVAEMRVVTNEELFAVSRRVQSLEDELREFRPGGRTHAELESLRGVVGRMRAERNLEQAADVRELREEMKALCDRIDGFHDLRELRDDVRDVQRQSAILVARLEEVEEGLEESRCQAQGQQPPDERLMLSSALEEQIAPLRSDVAHLQKEVHGYLSAGGQGYDVAAKSATPSKTMEDQLVSLLSEVAHLQEELRRHRSHAQEANASMAMLSSTMEGQLLTLRAEVAHLQEQAAAKPPMLLSTQEDNFAALRSEVAQLQDEVRRQASTASGNQGQEVATKNKGFHELRGALDLMQQQQSHLDTSLRSMSGELSMLTKRLGGVSERVLELESCEARPAIGAGRPAQQPQQQQPHVAQQPQGASPAAARGPAAPAALPAAALPAAALGPQDLRAQCAELQSHLLRLDASVQRIGSTGTFSAGAQAENVEACRSSFQSAVEEPDDRGEDTASKGTKDRLAEIGEEVTQLQREMAKFVADVNAKLRETDVRLEHVAELVALKDQIANLCKLDVELHSKLRPVCAAPKVADGGDFKEPVSFIQQQHMGISAWLHAADRNLDTVCSVQRLTEQQRQLDGRLLAAERICQQVFEIQNKADAVVNKSADTLSTQISTCSHQAQEPPSCQEPDEGSALHRRVEGQVSMLGGSVSDLAGIVKELLQTTALPGDAADFEASAKEAHRRFQEVMPLVQDMDRRMSALQTQVEACTSCSPRPLAIQADVQHKTDGDLQGCFDLQDVKCRLDRVTSRCDEVQAVVRRLAVELQTTLPDGGQKNIGDVQVEVAGLCSRMEAAETAIEELSDVSVLREHVFKGEARHAELDDRLRGAERALEETPSASEVRVQLGALRGELAEVQARLEEVDSGAIAALEAHARGVANGVRALAICKEADSKIPVGDGLQQLQERVEGLASRLDAVAANQKMNSVKESERCLASAQGPEEVKQCVPATEVNEGNVEVTGVHSRLAICQEKLLQLEGRLDDAAVCREKVTALELRLDSMTAHHHSEVLSTRRALGDQDKAIRLEVPSTMSPTRPDSPVELERQLGVAAMSHDRLVELERRLEITQVEQSRLAQLQRSIADNVCSMAELKTCLAGATNNQEKVAELEGRLESTMVNLGRVADLGARLESAMADLDKVAELQSVAEASQAKMAEMERRLDNAAANEGKLRKLERRLECAAGKQEALAELEQSAAQDRGKVAELEASAVADRDRVVELERSLASTVAKLDAVVALEKQDKWAEWHQRLEGAAAAQDRMAALEQRLERLVQSAAGNLDSLAVVERCQDRMAELERRLGVAALGLENIADVEEGTSANKDSFAKMEKHLEVACANQNKTVELEENATAYSAVLEQRLQIATESQFRLDELEQHLLMLTEARQQHQDRLVQLERSAEAHQEKVAELERARLEVAAEKHGRVGDLESRVDIIVARQQEKLAELEQRLGSAAESQGKVTDLERRVDSIAEHHKKVLELERSAAQNQDKVAQLEVRLANAGSNQERVIELETRLEAAMAYQDKVVQLEKCAAANQGKVAELEERLQGAATQQDKVTELELRFESTLASQGRVAELERSAAENHDKVAELEWQLANSAANCDRVTELERRLESATAILDKVAKLEIEATNKERVVEMERGWDRAAAEQDRVTELERVVAANLGKVAEMERRLIAELERCAAANLDKVVELERRLESTVANQERVVDLEIKLESATANQDKLIELEQRLASAAENQEKLVELEKNAAANLEKLAELERRLLMELERCATASQKKLADLERRLESSAVNHERVAALEAHLESAATNQGKVLELERSLEKAVAKQDKVTDLELRLESFAANQDMVLELERRLASVAANQAKLAELELGAAANQDKVLELERRLESGSKQDKALERLAADRVADLERRLGGTEASRALAAQWLEGFGALTQRVSDLEERMDQAERVERAQPLQDRRGQAGEVTAEVRELQAAIGNLRGEQLQLGRKLEAGLLDAELLLKEATEARELREELLRLVGRVDELQTGLQGAGSGLAVQQRLQHQQHQQQEWEQQVGSLQAQCEGVLARMEAAERGLLVQSGACQEQRRGAEALAGRLAKLEGRLEKADGALDTRGGSHSRPALVMQQVLGDGGAEALQRLVAESDAKVSNLEGQMLGLQALTLELSEWAKASSELVGSVDDLRERLAAVEAPGELINSVAMLRGRLDGFEALAASVREMKLRLQALEVRDEVTKIEPAGVDRRIRKQLHADEVTGLEKSMDDARAHVRAEWAVAATEAESDDTSCGQHKPSKRSETMDDDDAGRPGDVTELKAHVRCLYGQIHSLQELAAVSPEPLCKDSINSRLVVLERAAAAAERRVRLDTHRAEALAAVESRVTAVAERLDDVCLRLDEAESGLEAAGRSGVQMRMRLENVASVADAKIAALSADVADTAARQALAERHLADTARGPTPRAKSTPFLQLGVVPALAPAALAPAAAPRELADATKSPKSPSMP